MIQGGTMKSCLYCCLLIIGILSKLCFTFETPPVQLDVIGNGFTIHFPDDPGIRKVFFVINVNGKCPALMDMLMKSKNELWSTTHTSVQLQPKDMLKISLLVNYNGEAFHSSQYIVVGENNNKASMSSNIAERNRGKCLSGMESPPSHCEAAQTVVKGKLNICRNQLIFEENFDNPALDMTKWSYDIRNLLTGKNTEEFAVFDNREENVFISDGYLNIMPTITKDNMREASINFGSRCTPVSKVRNECKMFPIHPNIYVPPVNSSQIHTRDSFKFQYGKVEVRAKLPKGDWLLPNVVLQNYGPFERKQIRIAFARGNDHLFTTSDSQNIGGRRLYGGIVKDDESRSEILRQTYNADHYGNSFHTYILTWTTDVITLGVDDQVYGEIRENLSDYNDEFFLTLGVSAGGHLEFPDNLQNSSDKPWQNTSPRAMQSFWQGLKNGKIVWNNADATMQIDYVKIYAI